MHYTRISADCHIDMPWLPPDLFTSNASALMKDRMPYVVDGPDGPQWTTKKGAPFGLVGGIGSTGTKYVPGQNQRVDVMAATGLYDDQPLQRCYRDLHAANAHISMMWEAQATTFGRVALGLPCDNPTL